MSLRGQNSHFKGLRSILITAVCPGPHHSHAIAESNDSPYGLLGTLDDSTPERRHAKSRGQRFVPASSQPVHRTQLTESF